MIELMSVATQKKYPSLAEIVREETDNGRRIVQFYLGVAEGTLEGFRDHHRAAAARRIDKIAPGLVAEYLVKFAPTHLRDSYRGIRSMGSIAPMKKETPERRERGPNIFERRLHKLVRKETNDGRAVVYFLCGVMHGTLLGFKPHHRLEAANELASHITHTPSPSTGEGWGEGDSPVAPEKSETQKTPGRASDPNIVRPEPVPSLPRTRYGGEGDSPVTPAKSHSNPVVPEKSEPAPYSIRGTHPRSQSSQSPNHTNQSSDNAPIKNPKPKTSPQSPSAPSAVNSPPISLEELEQNNFDSHHIARYKFARDEITGAIYAFDGLGPVVVDEDGVTHSISPDRIAGYDRASRTSQDSRTNQKRYPAGRTARTRNRRRKNPNSPTKNPQPTTLHNRRSRGGGNPTPALPPPVRHPKSGCNKIEMGALPPSPLMGEGWGEGDPPPACRSLPTV